MKMIASSEFITDVLNLGQFGFTIKSININSEYLYEISLSNDSVSCEEVKLNFSRDHNGNHMVTCLLDGVVYKTLPNLFSPPKMVETQLVKSNGRFSIIREPFDHNQHSNQQCGLDKYVSVLDHHTGCVNTVKLYKNTKGLHFKKGGAWYLTEFTEDYLYVPFQIKAI